MAINRIKPRQICEIGLIALGALAAILFCVYLIWLAASFWAYGDDNESDLGLCLNYHIQVACDRADIKMYTDQLLQIANNTCDFANESCSQIIAPQIQGGKH